MINKTICTLFLFSDGFLFCFCAKILSGINTDCILCWQEAKVSLHVCLHRSPNMSGHELTAGRCDPNVSLAVHGVQDLFHL